MTLEVQYRPLAELTPYENNSRVHSPDQLDQLEKSLIEYGFTNPILVDENVQIIAGHARAVVAKRLEMTHVPTIQITGLTDIQKRAYVIADNKLAMNADWDFETLTAEIRSLQEDDFDLLLTGFDERELVSFLDPNTVEDPVGEWQKGMPEFVAEKVSFRSLIVHFRNQEDMDQFMALVDQPYTDQTKYIWYPRAEFEKVEDLRWVAESEGSDAE